MNCINCSQASSEGASANARTASRQPSGGEPIDSNAVSRRVGQLEEQLGVRLFERRSDGLILTAAGLELLDLASEVEERMDTLNRRLHGRDLALRGSVRLSLPDFAVRPVVAHLGAFTEQFPRIDVEVIVDNGFAELGQREADLVLRLATSPRPQLIGRRIATTRLCPYGSPAYLADRQRPLDLTRNKARRRTLRGSAAGPQVRVPGDARGSPPLPAKLTRLDWIRWDEPWASAPTERWIDANVPEERVRGRVNTSLAQAEVLASGRGVGFKLCYTGDADSRLVRAGPPMDFGFALWLLTHDDMKNNARVRVLMRFLGDVLATDRLRFIGPESITADPDEVTTRPATAGSD